MPAYTQRPRRRIRGFRGAGTTEPGRGAPRVGPRRPSPSRSPPGKPAPRGRAAGWRASLTEQQTRGRPPDSPAPPKSCRASGQDPADRMSSTYSSRPRRLLRRGLHRTVTRSSRRGDYTSRHAPLRAPAQWTRAAFAGVRPLRRRSGTLRTGLLGAAQGSGVTIGTAGHGAPGPGAFPL